MNNFKKVLKSLSDTELISISKEISDPNISNISIISQLMAKSNEEDKNLYTPNQPNIDMQFCINMILELSNRLLECDRDIKHIIKDEPIECLAAHGADEL